MLFTVAVLRTAGTVRLPGTDAASPLPTGAGGQGLIDPNTATRWELTTLPGIGETLARRIVEFREDHGAEAEGIPAGPVFTDPASLQRVHGIGPKKAAAMAPFLKFSGGVAPH